MVGCRYKTQVLDEEWECPFDALTGERYCYWHKEEDGKEPTEEQLEELRRRVIYGLYLQKANLTGANLRGANLTMANLQGAKLYVTNLQEAGLSLADLQDANLSWSNLQDANLSVANLRGAKLYKADLPGARLSNAYLQGTDLYSVKFDSKTDWTNSTLVGANLFHSYFDETKSFRNATVFQKEGDKEINEIAGDALGNSRLKVLDIWVRLKRKHPVLLQGSGDWG